MPPFDTPRSEWPDAVYSTPLSEGAHRAAWAPPRARYVAPRTPDDQALDHILAWLQSTDLRARRPDGQFVIQSELPEGGPLPGGRPLEDE